MTCRQALQLRCVVFKPRPFCVVPGTKCSDWGQHIAEKKRQSGGRREKSTRRQKSSERLSAPVAAQIRDKKQRYGVGKQGDKTDGDVRAQSTLFPGIAVQVAQIQDRACRPVSTATPALCLSFLHEDLGGASGGSTRSAGIAAQPRIR